MYIHIFKYIQAPASGGFGKAGALEQSGFTQSPARSPCTLPMRVGTVYLSVWAPMCARAGNPRPSICLSGRRCAHAWGDYCSSMIP